MCAVAITTASALTTSIASSFLLMDVVSCLKRHAYYFAMHWYFLHTAPLFVDLLVIVKSPVFC